jgi:cell wall-associated NlpC family hydrolase
MAKKGVKLPHSAKQQYQMGKAVEKSDLQEGDLIFFNTRGPITHVGMYLGNGVFVHAANPRAGVTVSSLNTAYYQKTYAGARRFASKES